MKKTYEVTARAVYFQTFEVEAESMAEANEIAEREMCNICPGLDGWCESSDIEKIEESELNPDEDGED